MTIANIMIVDDSPLIRQSLRSLFEELGHRVVVEAANGKEAIEYYNEHEIDLVTMDIEMPGISGIEAVRLIREQDPNASIVMISSVENRGKVFEAIKLGARHYFVKPFSAAKVSEVVETVLGLEMKPVTQQLEQVKSTNNSQELIANEYPIISKLDQKDLLAILPYIVENEYPAGTVLLSENQVSDCFHIIVSGRVAVFMENERDISLAKLERGQLIGGWNCLTREPVHAMFRTEEQVRTLSLPRAGLLKLMDKSTSFRNQIIEEMIKHIGESDEQVKQQTLGSEAARRPVVLRQLDQKRELRYGSLVGRSLFMHDLNERIHRLATEEGMLCLIGEKGVGKFHIATEIHYRSSRRHQTVLSINGASYHPNEWESTVKAVQGGTLLIEQADLFPIPLLHRLIYSVGNARIIMTASSKPDVNAQAVAIMPLRGRPEDIEDLVYEFLLRLGVSDPREAILDDAMRLLTIFPFLGDNIEGLKRVVSQALILSEGRMIRSMHLRFDRVREQGARPTIGLALGSGSVRGAAHVGVLKVLEEEKIPIDLVAGTSVGAFIGALYVGGQPISAFERVLPTVRWRQLVNLAWPLNALADNRRMAAFLEKYIGPVNFEDLPIPFAAVAADASTGESYILNKGRVSQAICASTAIPGVMKPVNYNNRWLVDGGIVHAVPVALAKSMGADIVIAVNLSTASFSRKSSKSFVSSILNTIEVMSDKLVQDELQLADIVLNPQLNIHEVTFKSSAAYIQAGVEVTRDAVSAIRRKIDAVSGKH